MVHEGQRGLIDVGARNVPARREARLVEDNRSLGISDDAVTVADDQSTGRLADINAMVAVGGMAHDPFVVFLEGIHGRPSKCDSRSQAGSIARELPALPC